MILDPSHSLAVQLNFRNFRKFRNKCFAVFRHVSQIMFRKFRKYEFRKVSQSPPPPRSFPFVSQDSQAFANKSFARLRNSQFRKNSKLGFSFRKFRKGFLNGHCGSLLM